MSLRQLYRLAGRLASLLLMVGAGIASAEELPLPPLAPAATTYNRAQVLDWISPGRFAVGRWDGTVSVFRTPAAGEFGPMAEQAWTLPGGRGIEMLSALDARTLAMSDGAAAIALWKTDRKGIFHPWRRLSYAASFGSANSGLALGQGPGGWFASGHESGYLLLWQRRLGSYTLRHSLDLHSPAPIAAPHPLRNIRDLVPWREGRLVAASEDGDIVGIDVAAGREVFRRRYNPGAQRGINDLAIAGDWLLVANCAVGATDRNLWLFDLSSGQPVLSDAINLALDRQRAQVFNFDIELIAGSAGVLFFASTEEGLLWRGEVRAGKLLPTGMSRIADAGGATIDASPDAALLAAAAYQIFLFRTQQ